MDLHKAKLINGKMTRSSSVAVNLVCSLKKKEDLNAVNLQARSGESMCEVGEREVRRKSR